jgi:hypothetical protein
VVLTITLKRHLAALGAGACLFLGIGASCAQASTAGIRPPHNPASNCGADGGTIGIAAIDACRARENVGPLRLPSNWSSLSAADQGLVLIDLERVNRGLPPIAGLSAPLNVLASAGADAGADPSFPAGSVSGGGIWGGSHSVFGADFMWMYSDGPGGDNLDCTSAGSSGCWGHRDIVLWDRTRAPLVAGGGFATAGGTDSFAYLVLSGYSMSGLTFTWAGELKHFATRPGVEPLSKTAAAERRRRKSLHHRRHRHRHGRHRHRHGRHRRHHRARYVTPVASTGSGPTISFA